MVNQITERLDFRMNECAKRNEMTDGFARVVNQMADMKVEILRWSFAFWVGQVAVDRGAAVVHVEVIGRAITGKIRRMHKFAGIYTPLATPFAARRQPRHCARSRATSRNICSRR